MCPMWLFLHSVLFGVYFMYHFHIFFVLVIFFYRSYLLSTYFHVHLIFTYPVYFLVIFVLCILYCNMLSYLYYVFRLHLNSLLLNVDSNKSINQFLLGLGRPSGFTFLRQPLDGSTGRHHCGICHDGT